MIYAEIEINTTAPTQGGQDPLVDISFVFYGQEVDEKFWAERIKQYMAKLKKPNHKEVFRFFANEGWTRSSARHFFRRSADPKKKG